MAQNPVSMDIRLFESGEFADCKVTCNGREFKTHRLILSSRSQYFCKVFDEKWEESQTGEVRLNDHEPEKIEWLLRFIYHQDLKWHRANVNSTTGFLPMLIELIVLGDYFLMNDLVDAAREATLDVCSNFTVKFWSHHLGQPTKTDGISTTFEEDMNEIMKAITLTSAASGPTHPFRKLLVKLIVDVFGRTPGISAWSYDEMLLFRRQSRLAAKFRDLVIGMPDIENELKSALFDSAFPNLAGDDSQQSQYPRSPYYTSDNICPACRRHLNVDEGEKGLTFSPTYDCGREACCLRCAKNVLTEAWRDFMMDDGRRE